MQRLNRVIYVLVNILWALGVIFSGFLYIGGISTVTHALNTITLFIIALFQIYGGITLWKNNVIIPIITTGFFLISIDLNGFKYVTTTLFYFLFEINTNGVTINGTIFGDPTILINLSFAPITFNSISTNLVAWVQIGLLLHEYDIPDSEKKA